MLEALQRPVLAVRALAAAATNAQLVALGSAMFVVANCLLATELAPLAGVIVLAASLGAVALLMVSDRGRSGPLMAARVDWASLCACTALAFSICILGGEGHFFHANEDWLMRDAVLGDLARNRFPVTYSYQGTEYLLRAPLGMYLWPAAIGHQFGVGAAHAAMVLQNSVILAVTLYVFAALAKVRRVAFLALFVAFSGLDVIPTAMLAWKDSGTFWLPRHLENWMPYAMYMSHVTGLFWAPNHVLPGLWFGGLALLRARGEIGTAHLVVAVAALALWSPLAMIGAAAVLVYFIASEYRALAAARSWWCACLVAAGFIPVALYLTADAGAVGHGWQFGKKDFAQNLVMFLAFEVPHLLIVEKLWRSVERELRGLLLMTVGLLVVLPMYAMGPNNDFTMRAAIVPLAILAFVFATTVLAHARASGRGVMLFAGAIVLIGAVTPGFEVMRALTFKPFAISSCNLLTSWQQFDPERWMANYMARVDQLPPWLVRVDRSAAPLALESAKCWPDHPIDPLPIDWLEPRYRFPAR